MLSCLRIHVAFSFIASFVASLVACLLVACGQSPARTAPVASSAAAANTFSVKGWQSWPKMNSERMWSRSHSKVWVDVYVDPKFVDAYQSKANPAPVGMRVVKSIYADKASKQALRLTAMEKRAPGYDPEQSDWFYAVLAADGVRVKASGRIDMCSACHSLAEGADYLYYPQGSGEWKDGFHNPDEFYKR